MVSNYQPYYPAQLKTTTEKTSTVTFQPIVSFDVIPSKHDKTQELPKVAPFTDSMQEFKQINGIMANAIGVKFMTTTPTNDDLNQNGFVAYKDKNNIIQLYNQNGLLPMDTIKSKNKLFYQSLQTIQDDSELRSLIITHANYITTNNYYINGTLGNLQKYEIRIYLNICIGLILYYILMAVLYVFIKINRNL